MKRTLMLFMVLMAVLSCSYESATLYHEYQSTKRGGWSATDTLRFQIPRVRETAEYSFSIGMRLHHTFPYKGLWIVSETRLKNPDVVLRDTILFRTTQDDGMPKGKGVNLQQDEQEYAIFELYRGQTGEVCFYHAMTREVIPAVINVGLKVEQK